MKYLFEHFFVCVENLTQVSGTKSSIILNWRFYCWKINLFCLQISVLTHEHFTANEFPPSHFGCPFVMIVWWNRYKSLLFSQWNCGFGIQGNKMWLMSFLILCFVTCLTEKVEEFISQFSVNPCFILNFSVFFG